VFFAMISTFVYLLYPNMIVVLASSMILTDLLFFVKRQKKEGFDGSMNTDGSMNDLSMNDSSMDLMDGSMNTLTNPFVTSEKFVNSDTSQPTRYLESFVKGMFQKESGNDLTELDSESSALDKKIQFTKQSTPELSDPELSDVSKINVAEFNTLMNRLNTMLGTVAD